MSLTEQPANSIAACLNLASELSSDTARLDCELLVLHVIKKNRSFLFSHPEFSLDDDQYAQFKALFQRRKKGEPIAYLVGSQAFWTLDLEVNSSTLIPRPETELLVELALDKAQSESNILDLGTGTGAIALALASELSDAEVLGVDQSDEIVNLANKNKARAGVTNAHFKCSHWLQSVSGVYDLIVSNPPYIELNDVHLSRGDVRFEPSSALVSGEDGLDDIRCIVRDSIEYLSDDAWLLIEHGYNQAEAVQMLFAKSGFADIETVKDLSNNDRVTMGHWLP